VVVGILVVGDSWQFGAPGSARIGASWGYCVHIVMVVLAGFVALFVVSKELLVTGLLLVLFMCGIIMVMSRVLQWAGKVLGKVIVYMLALNSAKSICGGDGAMDSRQFVLVVGSDGLLFGQ